MKIALLLTVLFLTASPSAVAAGLDDPIAVASMADYFAVRQEAGIKLSQEDYARFVDSIDLIHRQIRTQLLKDPSSTSDEAVFFAVVNRKSPREIIILASILALERCNVVQLENESLLKDGDQTKAELYKLRAKEASEMRYLYFELIAKYARQPKAEKQESSSSGSH